MGVAAIAAIGDFSGGEHLREETIAVSLDGRRHARDLCRIDPETYNVHQPVDPT